MLLYIFLIASGFVIFARLKEYFSNRRSMIADDVCDLLGIEAQFEKIYSAEFDPQSPEYSQEQYFANAKDFHGTFKYHLSNKLHSFHSAGELSKKRSFLKNNPKAEIDKIFPGFETEVRRISHKLTEELKTKLHNDALAELEGTKRKRRRRR
jgi:hypothetical protein